MQIVIRSRMTNAASRIQPIFRNLRAMFFVFAISYLSGTMIIARKKYPI